MLGLGGAVAGVLLPLPIPGLPTSSQVTVMIMMMMVIMTIITLVTMMMVVMTMSSLCVTPISTWGLVSCLLVSTVAAVFTLVATIGHSLHLVRD